MCRWTPKFRKRQAASDLAKDLEIEQAQAELAEWKYRERQATTFLLERNDRNHWKESIQQVITGRATPP